MFNKVVFLLFDIVSAILNTHCLSFCKIKVSNEEQNLKK